MQTRMVNKQWSEKYPNVGTGPVSTEPCISPEYFERERELIFRRHWINLGRVEEIPGAGDYLVRELAVCKVSVLVVRGRDHQVRAFYNVCPHRGRQLISVPDGVHSVRGNNRTSFICGFHGLLLPSPEVGAQGG